jgi:hypothetical protein
MPDPFQKLRDRVSFLGNHHQKHIRSIEAHKDSLIEGLESKGKIDQVHLWKSAPDLPAEMDVILELGDTIEEKAAFLGCYYSLQFLHMNLRLTDVLQLNLTAARDRNEVFRDFMIHSGLEFRSLTGNYMQRLLNLFISEPRRPEFVICGVGSRSDQDDIDIGIVDDGSERRDEFNKAVGKLRNEMLKHASCLHFYLSEHVVRRGYSASISDYRELLDREIHDFIIITEMLGAAPILGSLRLFDQFKREITWRYHYAPHQDNKYHEAYLRGILGEVRSLLIRQMQPDSIHLKDDGLRMLKSMIYVEKTIFRIDKVNPWDILRDLRQRNPSQRKLYDDLDRALTFLDTFRHLYQLFVVQEDEIQLGEPFTAADMVPVAQCMGYKDVGAIRGWDHLLIHYHESVQIAKDIVGILLEGVTEHLKSITIFSGLTQPRRPPRDLRPKKNLAVDFIRDSRFFRGTKFWDDVLETLESNNGELLYRFVRDFAARHGKIRRKLIEEYGSTGHNSFYALLSLLVIIAKHQRGPEYQKLFDELNDSFLETAAETEGRVSKLSKLFYQYPQLINSYLMRLKEEKLVRFERLLGDDRGEVEVSAAALRKLCELHYSNSRYFRRYFTRVVQKHPEYVQYLDDTERLRQIAHGLLGNVDNLAGYADKKESLSDYYDLEYLRVGLQTLHSVPIATTNAEFTEFSDTYLQVLFDINKQSIDDEMGGKVATRDLLAVFVAGGHAREQAYDDDYDLFILLNSRDEQMRRYCDRIANRMNSDILKRGTLPHYRFADHFGHYVTLVDELKQLLAQDSPDVFIDKSQVLGSRMIIGSTKFGKEFEDSVIRPYIFDRSKEYIAQMIREIRSRHVNKAGRDGDVMNVKEGLGGLRDAEMVLLIYKAKYGLREPINRKLVKTLCEVESRHKEHFETLNTCFEFLRSVRDMYRLMVSADNLLHVEYLDLPAKSLGFGNADDLIAACRTCTSQVAEITERMIADAQASS